MTLSLDVSVARLALIALGLAAAAALVLWPLVFERARAAWPGDPSPARDEVARAVSSLRDLDFALAAGTITTTDHARMRSLLERETFVLPAPRAAGGAPLRTIVVAALLAGVAAAAIATTLPREVGDRAPGGIVTGGGGDPVAPTTAELEQRVRAAPDDIPTRLALADSYALDDRLPDAIRAYQEVLARDRWSVPALNGLALILVRAGEMDAASVAVDRILALRPRDVDGLFLKGLIRYRKADYPAAVEAWQRYLEVAEYEPEAAMVRPLFADAKAKAGARP